MSFVAVFDFIFFLASLLGLVFLIRGWKRAFRPDTRLLLSGLLIFSMAYGFCLAVEWSGLSTALDTFEDYIGALLPMLWAFVLYAFSHEISRGDLVESKEKLRRVIDNVVGSFIYRHDTEGQFVYVSRSIEKVLGYSREEFTGHFTNYLTDHPVNEKVCEYTQAGIAGAQQPPYEVEIFHKDGTLHWLEVKEVPVRDESGSVIAVEGIAHDITDRKKAEEEQRRLNAILEATSDLVSTATLDTQLTYMNRAGRELLGWTDQTDITQKKTCDCHPGWVNELIRDEVIATAMEKGLWKGETAILGAEGQEIPVSQVVMSHRSPDGDVEYLSTIMRDISEAKDTERMLHERQETIRSLVETSKDWIWSMDLNGLHTYCNPAVEDILGYRPEELIGKAGLRLMHDEDRKIIEEKLPQWTSNKQGWSNTVLRWRHKNGSWRYLESNAVPILNADGDLLGFRGVDRDITDRRDAEDALRKSENQFRTLFESANDAIFVTDESTFLECNREALKMFRCDREDIVGHTPTEFSPPEQPNGRVSAEMAREKIDLAFAGEPQRFEWTHLRKDGSAFCTEVSLNRLDMPDRTYLQAIVRNIDDSKQAQEALRISEEKLSKAFHSSPNIMGIFDMATGRRLEVGGTFSDITGYSYEELVGTRIGELNLFVDKEKVDEALQVLKEKGTIRDVELRIRTKFGQERTIRYAAEVFETEGNKLAIITGEDITDHKKAEAEREHLLKTLAAKNEELESILYVSTHDLKSPIVNIQGFSEELGELCAELQESMGKKHTPAVDKRISSVINEAIPESLNFIQGGSQKIKSLLDGLLKVSRISSQDVNIETLDMDRLLTKIRRNMSYEIKERQVSLTLKKLPPCQGDADGIDQVFTNLIGNALKYLEPNRKGVISITGRVEGDVSIYCVEDNGVGISPDHQHRIFELFHRLDPDDGIEGQGLGLTIVRRILQRQNGDIRVESEPQKGSRFYVSLPRSPQPAFV